MKVLLTEDVEKLGMAGEVHQVADGYGRNYLIPRAMAVKATTGALKQAEMWRERAAARRAQLRAEHQNLAARIQDVRLYFSARAGETGKLYGSITMAQVTEKLNETIGTELDRHKVEGEPLRQLGEHAITARLSADHQPQFTAVVMREGVSPEEYEAAQAAAAQEIVEAEAGDDEDTE